MLSHRRFSAVARDTAVAAAAISLVLTAASAAAPPNRWQRAVSKRTTREISVVRELRKCRSAHGRRRAKRKARHACRPVRAVAQEVKRGVIVGINADVSGWGGASTAGYLDTIISQTGARWLRERFLWSTIEPTPGTFSFAYFDHFMLVAAQHGERVLALLGNAPPWAAASPIAVPSDPSAYAAYVAAVVKRYGPHGTFWTAHPRLRASAITTFELWNEPYYDSGNNGDYDPGRYARLVKAAGIAGHRADPDAAFLLSAEMQSARAPNGDWLWWTDALYRAVPDLNRYFDGVSIHDYGSDVTTLHPLVPGQAYDNYDHVRRAEDIRRQFVSHGAADKPFWITEAGWSTCTEASPDCVPAAQQAANLTTLFGYVRGSWNSWVRAIFVYRFADGADPGTVQEGYGLTNLDGTPKPALSVFKALAM